jgi:NAD(P)-dependent dehydrogenase (short-subunit alcohol dehydrogenase family)
MRRLAKDFATGTEEEEGAVRDFPHVVVVTGAGSGIGRACAISLANEGAHVAVLDVSTANAEAVTDEILASGHVAMALTCDVSDGAQVQASIEAIQGAWGHVDGLVNNAGVIGPVIESARLSLSDVERVLDVNVIGTWLVMSHVIPGMVARGGGAIVNMSSALGLRGGAMQSIYSASKHAVIGLTKSAAIEYAASGVRVNAVCPGVIRTPALQGRIDDGDPAIDSLLAEHPVGRFGTPEEIASVVTWLLSGAASFVTGAVVAADGAYGA